MAYEAFYSVRSSEIGSDYRLTKTGAAFFFQECAAEYFTSKGLAGYDMARHSLTWLISGVETRFSGQMPFWRERVKVQVWIRGVSAARMYVNFIQQDEKGETFARGEADYLVAEVPSHRPCKISEYSEAFDIENMSALSGYCKIFEMCSIARNGEYTQKVSRKVRFDDIDFNSHLTNVKYLPRAVEALPDDFLISRKLAGYSIKFKREAKMGDTVVSIARVYCDCALHDLSCGGKTIAEAATIWERI